MVKILIICVSLFISLNASPKKQNNITLDIKNIELVEKIKTFISDTKYEENKRFINIIFKPTKKYFTKDMINDVKVIKTLKENGLLKLLFDKPQELKLSFKTSSSPIFFIKVVGDTLNNIGYYRYVTTKSNLDNSEFIWNISMESEYATDPLILDKELHKMGAYIVNIKRNSYNNWEYTINMEKAKLNLYTLKVNEEYKLKRSLYASWLNVSKIQKLKIYSSIRNNWYPKISYYDSSLHLLNVIEKQKKITTILLDIPKQAQYIKISDSYTLKNIKSNLILTPSVLR